MGEKKITEEELDKGLELFDDAFLQPDGWELISTTKRPYKCHIYRKLQEETGLFQYFCKGVFEDFPARVLYALGLDNEHRLTWDEYALDIKSLQEYEDGTQCYYWLVKFPWPLWNRDYVCYRRGKISADKKYFFTISKSGTHISMGETKNAVRVDSYHSISALKHVDEQTTEFRLWYFDDLKGNIPKSVVNWAVGTAVPNFLKTMHKIAKEFPAHRVTKFVPDANVNT